MENSNEIQDKRLAALEEAQRKITERQEEILVILRPLADTYRTASTLGKWIMALLVFVSILLGVIASVRGLIK